MNGTSTNNRNPSPSKRRNQASSSSVYNQNSSTSTGQAVSEKPKSTNIKGDNLRDTTVNVASAFSQAVQDYAMSNGAATNGYTTARTNGLGAPPPSRARKPASRGVAARGGDGSDDEGAPASRTRAKSPLLEAASQFARALSPGGSLYLRQRAGGADDSMYQSMSGAFSGMQPPASSQASTARVGGTQNSQTSHGNVSSDYNYSREESLIKRMDPPPSGKPISTISNTSAAAKNRLSHRPSTTSINYDKQAYRPPIDEEEEDPEDWSEDERGQRRKRARAGPTQKNQSAFSIGGFLGKVVNLSFHAFATLLEFAISTITALVILVIRIAVSIVDVCVVQPFKFVADRGQKVIGSVDWNSVGKVIFGLILAWLFFNALAGPNRGSNLPGGGWGNKSPAPPVIPTGDSNAALVEIARRLQKMEGEIIDMQYAQRRVFDRLDTQTRISDETNHKLQSIDTTIGSQNKARVEAEEKLRASSSSAVTSLRNEISSMINQIGHMDQSGSVEKILYLEKRLQVAEAGVKDAMEVSKQALNTANTKSVAPGSKGGNRAWSMFGTGDGKQAITIRSTDGHDVTGLIGSLVSEAVLRASKDDIARPDYASYFAGARIIPQLTSQTFRIKANSYWGVWGLFGQQTVEGRPPVTAIHPDIHVGNCWPIKGHEGQLGVVLARSIVITEFTIDHAAKEVAFDVRSAPKKMEVWGLVEGAENLKKVADYHRRREQRYRDLVTAAGREGRTPPSPEDPYPASLPPDANYIRLGQFSYDVNAHSHIQTFQVPQDIQELGVDIGIVVLMIKSNWGEPNWTCLYRFRVSGHDLDRKPAPMEEIEE
ncbi:hypothetical protein FRC16_008645 [Serendipita sp. 398]|nr:hypothetical protein FRC16_008645 [Serendipita sp. 398]